MSHFQGIFSRPLLPHGGTSNKDLHQSSLPDPLPQIELCRHHINLINRHYWEIQYRHTTSLVLTLNNFLDQWVVYKLCIGILSWGKVIIPFSKLPIPIWVHQNMCLFIDLLLKHLTCAYTLKDFIGLEEERIGLEARPPIIGHTIDSYYIVKAACLLAVHLFIPYQQKLFLSSGCGHLVRSRT